jgi:alkanesulfonate monooxygenase SsuD/methylene tetrahydromethanopterin reductase-like flavin-dependent oxidoreductase (luciferase family)
MAMFGIRFDLRNPGFAGVAMADRYRATLDMVEWADRLGGMFVGLSEHHGSDDGYLPSPLPMAAAIAARTSTIQISIVALIAPFHDPLRLAEDIAVVDLLSDGRLDLTIAGGYVRGEFAMFDVPMSQRPARVREALSTLKAAWSGAPFEYRGRTVRITPTPAQPGGPKLVLGGSSEAAARRAARIADGFMPSDPRFWTFYQDECAKLGKPDPGPYLGGGTSVVALAEDPDAGWEALSPYFLHEMNAYGTWQAEDGVQTTYWNVESADELRATGQYRVLTPDAYAAELRDAGPFAFAMLHPMVGGIPPDLAWESLRLFEHEVLPKLT